MRRSEQTYSVKVSAKPFLRWAGGKQKLASLILGLAPPRDSYRNYYEPFLGGGSLFFALQPNVGVLSDVNSDLMNCYKQVARCPRLISRMLTTYAEKNSREFFYDVRATPLAQLSCEEQAARFIYLNKAAFNGIYRVNRRGEFNVPYGPTSDRPAIPSEETLCVAAKCLRQADLLSVDFEDALSTAQSGDFVYLDPPYPPHSDTAFFTHYSPSRFDWDQQVRVAKVFSQLADRGCLIMLSNADQQKVTKLYSRFRIHRLSAVRWLGSNGDRFTAREIIVTNYEPWRAG